MRGAVARPRRLVAVALVIAGCSGRGSCSGVPAGRADSPEAERACASWAARYCDRLEACAPATVTAGFGAVSECIARSRIACTDALAAAGTAATPSTVDACARAYESARCEDVVVDRAPPGCTQSGALPAGSRCVDSSQCADAGDDAGAAQMYCRITQATPCGMCAPLGAVGDGCDSDRDCRRGLVCYFTCLEPVAEGAACDGMARQCPQTLLCMDGRCVARATRGAPCNPRADGCDHDQALFCDSESKTCKPYALAESGQPCGVGTLCREGECAIAGTDGAGRCVANAADGAKCDPTDGPPCGPPARCVDGACTLADPSACR